MVLSNWKEMYLSIYSSTSTWYTYPYMMNIDKKDKSYHNPAIIEPSPNDMYSSSQDLPSPSLHRIGQASRTVSTYSISQFSGNRFILSVIPRQLNKWASHQEGPSNVNQALPETRGAQLAT